MYRKQNTDRIGNSWTETTKQSIWQKGTPIDGYPAIIWRRDVCGNAMKFADYGNRNSEYGWEIDHKNPVVNGGDDNYFNLQPLNWKNNASKGDSLTWTCK